MITLRPGQFLHASCSDEWYPILAVGEDGNGTPTIDIEVPDINEFIDCRWDDDGKDEPPWQRSNSDRFGKPSLMRVEPCKVVFRGLQWRETGHGLIECNTPGRGCYRCTELFSVHDRKEW